MTSGRCYDLHRDDVSTTLFLLHDDVSTTLFLDRDDVSTTLFLLRDDVKANLFHVCDDVWTKLFIYELKVWSYKLSVLIRYTRSYRGGSGVLQYGETLKIVRYLKTHYTGL